MGLLQRLRGVLRRATTANPAQWLIQAFTGGVSNASGVTVNTKTALGYPAFYAAVNLLSRGVAMLPWPVYERVEGDGKKRVRGHPAYRLLNERPNPEQTPYTFRETMQGWALTWGNGYAEIVRDGSGRPVELWCLPPNEIKPKRIDGHLVYEQTQHGKVVATLPAADVLHIRTLGDGLVGWSPVTIFAEAIGVGLAAQQHSATDLANDATPSGVLTTSDTLDDKAQKKLVADWKASHSGSTRRSVAVLEHGMNWQQMGIPAQDAQLIERQQFSVTDMARIFGIPPHKIGDLSNATFSNIEEQQIAYVGDGLMPWLTNWEQEATAKLLTPAERTRGMFTEFVIDGLLRGNVQSRYGAYAIARQWGWLSANDIRRLENMNPIGEGGDSYLVPLNMVPAGESRETPTDLPAQRALILDLCGKIERRRQREADKPDAAERFGRYFGEILETPLRAIAPGVDVQALTGRLATSPVIGSNGDWAARMTDRLMEGLTDGE